MGDFQCMRAGAVSPCMETPTWLAGRYFVLMNDFPIKDEPLINDFPTEIPISSRFPIAMFDSQRFSIGKHL